jgi:hypothetical protein
MSPLCRYSTSLEHENSPQYLSSDMVNLKLSHSAKYQVSYFHNMKQNMLFVGLMVK